MILMSNNYHKRKWLKEKQKKFFMRLHRMACHDSTKEEACLRSRIGNWNFLKRHILHVSQIKSYECSLIIILISIIAAHRFEDYMMENGVKHEFHST